MQAISSNFKKAPYSSNATTASSHSEFCVDLWYEGPETVWHGSDGLNAHRPKPAPHESEIGSRYMTSHIDKTQMEHGMDMKDPESNESGIFAQIEGLTQVDPAALEEFQRAMTEEVIPEIVQAVEERRMLAAESRHWQLKC